MRASSKTKLRSRSRTRSRSSPRVSVARRGHLDERIDLSVTAQRKPPTQRAGSTSSATRIGCRRGCVVQARESIFRSRPGISPW